MADSHRIFTKDEIKAMVIDQLTIYEREVVIPRHKQNHDDISAIRDMNEDQSKQLSEMKYTLRSLYRNGSGGPPGAVELLQDSMAEVKTSVNGLDKTLTYGKGWIAGAIFASGGLSGLLFFLLHHFIG